MSSLEYQAFKGCAKLKNVMLPNQLKAIGTSAFNGCTSLESVEIPESVSEIGSSAFQNCTSLKEVKMGDADLKEVKMCDAAKITMGISSFEGCPALADENGFTIVGGILLFYTGKGGDVIVPEGVTHIAPHAFEEDNEYIRRGFKKYREKGSLRSISLPKSLKKIYDYAFIGCIKLNEITWSEGLESIGDSAFFGCKILKSVAIPDSVINVGWNAFAACEELSNVSFGVGMTKISRKMFENCSSLKSVTISKNIKAIDQDAFASCKNLMEFSVDAENENYSAIDGILFSKDATELVFCPCEAKRTEYIVPDSVTKIATHAFIDCNDLKKVVIPENVSDIGDEVFSCKTSNKWMDIEVSPKAGAKSVGYRVFAFPFGDEPLTYPKLPVTFVQETTTQVRLGMGFCQHPEKFEGEYAEIYKKYVASHEKTIVKKAKQLRLTDSVYWNEYVHRLTQLKASEVAPVLERLTKLATAADKKLVISPKMFDEMNWNDKSLAFALENIDFAKINQKKAMEFAVDKNFIASLEIMAQAGWLSTAAKREKLIELARTNKKKEALAWLMDFKNRTVDVQAEAAKEEAKLIKELTENPNSVSELKKVWSYKKLDEGTLMITSYKGNAIDVEVPAVIGKVPVTVIGEDSFSASDQNSRIKNQAERKKIKSITIPEGVVEIQTHAFWSLDELEKLTLPSTVKKIGTPLAGCCEKLKEVNIPTDAKIVGDDILFIRCDELYDQNSCIIINNCLYTYNKLKTWAHAGGNIEIPDNVTEIAAHVFTAARMSSITLPNGLKVIGEKAFERCSFLGEVTIPGSVESVKSGAFIDCSALKTVKLENGVAAIDEKAFASCNNLRDIYIPKSVPKLGKEIFGAYDDNANSWNKVTGICVHTQKDSPAVEYMKKYSGVYVVFDYDE